VLGVPVMVPAELIDSPAGSPAPAQVRLAPAWVSWATRARAVMAVPLALDWSPGLVTATAPMMVQVKLAEPE
jgi:hypothetical protein